MDSRSQFRFDNGCFPLNWLAAVEAVEGGWRYFGAVLAEEVEEVVSEVLNLWGIYVFTVGGEAFCPLATSKRSCTQHLPFFLTREPEDQCFLTGYRVYASYFYGSMGLWSVIWSYGTMVFGFISMVCYYGSMGLWSLALFYAAMVC